VPAVDPAAGWPKAGICPVLTGAEPTPAKCERLFATDSAPLIRALRKYLGSTHARAKHSEDSLEAARVRLGSAFVSVFGDKTPAPMLGAYSVSQSELGAGVSSFPRSEAVRAGKCLLSITGMRDTLLR
jgi:hypothetical protein